MEPITFVPLYSMAMPQFMITITKASFVSTLVNIVVGIKSIPQTPRETNFMSLHENMPQEVNKVCINQPSNQGGGDSNPLKPLGPPRYFGLPMVHPGRPPLLPNGPYHRPLNYLEYVKNFNPYAHVKVFKVAIRANNETNYVKILNLFNSTLIDTMFDWCNNYLGDCPNCTFVELQLVFL